MAGVLRLLKLHILDWVMLLALGALEGVLNIIHPFSRFVGKTMLENLMYPLKGDTVPFWVVPIVAVGFPIVLFFLRFIKRRRFQDLHHAVLGLLFAILLTAVITDSLKDGLGQPRPDFFWRCFPDGVQVFNNTTGEVICHGDSKVIREGHKSFPSGHTSWLGFLSFYLRDRLKLNDRKGHVGKLVVVLAPLMLATAIGISRIDDYVHRWQDVVVGALLGLGMAFLCYKQFFPDLNEEGDIMDGGISGQHPSIMPPLWSTSQEDHNGSL